MRGPGQSLGGFSPRVAVYNRRPRRGVDILSPGEEIGFASRRDWTNAVRLAQPDRLAVEASEADADLPLAITGLSALRFVNEFIHFLFESRRRFELGDL